jgi:hypothetical protein
VPVAQLGRQLFTVSVPLPSAVLPLHSDHVTPDIDTAPAHPMSMEVGRTSCFGPGRQDITEGALVAGATGAHAVVVLECDDTEATEALVTTLPADIEGAGELRANPTAKPTPRAARTAAATPIRTTELRRILITCAFRCVEEDNRARGIARRLGCPIRRWKCADPAPFPLPVLSGFGDIR